MPLHAGAATRDITPTGPTFLVGYPHVERTSTGVHDPLLANALCLRHGDRTLCVISLDILQIDPPFARRLRQAVAERCQISPEGVLIGCTHTHSGPLTTDMLVWREDPVVPRPDPGYMALLERAVIEAAAEACGAMRPAEIATAKPLVTGVGANRHDPHGPADRECGALAVRDADSGDPIGLVLVYSMHPTVLHEDSTLVSADFPGAARTRLRDALGLDLPVVYLTGPCGNQSPRYSVRAQTFEEAERLGDLLAGPVLEALADLGADAWSTDWTLDAATDLVGLPQRQMPAVDEAEALLHRARETWERLRREGAGHGPVRTAECAVFGAEETVALARARASGALAETLQQYNPFEVQVLRIGQTFLAGLPGEVFVEYGLELKERAAALRPPARVFVASLVNGNSQGYLVTPEAARAGGYEAANSLFEAGAAGRLVDAALRLVADMER